MAMNPFQRAAGAFAGNQPSRAHSRYELTEVGSRKYEAAEERGNRLIILAAISRHQPALLKDIASDPQIINKFDYDEVQSIMQALNNDLLIRESVAR